MIRPNFLRLLSFGTKFSEHPNLSMKALPTISVFLDLFGFVPIFFVSPKSEKFSFEFCQKLV